MRQPTRRNIAQCHLLEIGLQATAVSRRHCDTARALRRLCKVQRTGDEIPASTCRARMASTAA